MASETFKTKDNGGLWIQPDGPNTKPYLLPCHDLEEIDAPQGGITLSQCFDGKGGWKTIGYTEEAPEPITTTLGTYTGKTRDWLEKVKCPFTVYVNLRDCGKVDVFDNFVRGMALSVAKVVDRKRMGLVRRSEDLNAESTFDVQILPPWSDYFSMTALRQAVSETEALNDIIMCSSEKCAGPCGDSVDLGDGGIAVGNAATGSPSNIANVLKTTNGGGTWAATAANPFAGAEHIMSAVCFDIGRTTTRWVVARGTADGANPAEIAYSDDSGATWTQVNVGSVNGQFANDSGALFALDQYHIWLVTNGGYIYFSDDGAITWTAQSSGTATTQTLRFVHFADEMNGIAGGNSNALLRTNDGGITWAVVTAPTLKAGVNINTGNMRDQNNIWLGYASATASAGNLWYTRDVASSSPTWSQRAHSKSSSGSIDDMDFVDDYQAIIVHNNSGGTLGTALNTVNGGYSWQEITGSASNNAGLNAVDFVSPTLAYIVGEPQGGTAVIYKVSGG